MFYNKRLGKNSNIKLISSFSWINDKNKNLPHIHAYVVVLHEYL